MKCFVSIGILGLCGVLALPAQAQDHQSPGTRYQGSAATTQNVGPMGSSIMSADRGVVGSRSSAAEEVYREDVESTLRNNRYRLKKLERLLIQDGLSDADRHALMDVRQGLLDEISREENMLQNS